MNYWGCDPGTRKLALACVEGGVLKGVVSVALPADEDEGKKLAAVQEAGKDLAHTLWAAHGAPQAILVEQPSGRFSNLSLTYSVGATIVALSKHGFVFTFPSRRWRKEVFGNGGMRSQEAKAAAIQLAQSIGYTGKNDDEAEAICMALCAERTHNV